MENVVTQSPNTIIEGGNVISTKITYEDFLVKYDGKYAEFVSGEVIANMSVTKTHNEITNFLTFILQAFGEIKKIGKVYGEPYQMKMRFGDEIIGREPDIFFVKNESFDKLNEKFFDGGADLVIEVVSPESVYRDTQDKFEEYEKIGVKEYWLIDYTRRTANFYGFDDTGKYKLLPISGEGKFESRILEGVWIKTDWLWQDELPTLMEILKDWKLV
jgi:Uma2 family endonuclease